MAEASGMNACESSPGLDATRSSMIHSDSALTRDGKPAEESGSPASPLPSQSARGGRSFPRGKGRGKAGKPGQPFASSGDGSTSSSTRRQQQAHRPGYSKQIRPSSSKQMHQQKSRHPEKVIHEGNDACDSATQSQPGEISKELGPKQSDSHSVKTRPHNITRGTSYANEEVCPGATGGKVGSGRYPSKKSAKKQNARNPHTSDAGGKQRGKPGNFTKRKDDNVDTCEMNPSHGNTSRNVDQDHQRNVTVDMSAMINGNVTDGVYRPKGNMLGRGRHGDSVTFMDRKGYEGRQEGSIVSENATHNLVLPNGAYEAKGNGRGKGRQGNRATFMDNKGYKKQQEKSVSKKLATNNLGSVTDGAYGTKGNVQSEMGKGHHGNQPATFRDGKGYGGPQESFNTQKATDNLGAVTKPKETINQILKDTVVENQQISNKTSQSSVQASVLIEQLTEEKYECMVCYENIRCSKAVWCCSKCYHIFHLFCIKRWAKSPTAITCDGERRGWRCPACQFIECTTPSVYTCFCGKVEEPKWYPQDGITPHSCGELCLKKRSDQRCPHPCSQLCHPGPCPSCPVTVTRKCCCSKTAFPVRCGKSDEVTCSSVCEKLLNCGIHTCQDGCHAGPCEKCDVTTKHKCYCGKSEKDALCGTERATIINGEPGYFSCDAVCAKQLECGHHECDQICHPSECSKCLLQPSVVTHCPCGKKTVVELLNGSERNSCQDAIPTCGNPCARALPCAKYNDMSKATSDHRCTKLCHLGDCSSCQSDSIVKCRCRGTLKKLSCEELNASSTDEPFLCAIKCNNFKDCSKHRCTEKCCLGRRRDTKKHPCDFICAKRLNCGIHKCTEVCHIFTPCPPCLMAGFEEVFCPCGNVVQEPPIPCGTPPPTCYNTCSRQHPCQHEVQHTCHYEDECPPCTVLVSKWCMGQHKLRDNIPCYVDCVSCGEECRKMLPCDKHRCRRMCHQNPCLEENEHCKQTCSSFRESCGHPCDAPCHEGDCPKVPCKYKIRIYCKCGRKSKDSVCLKGGDVMEAAQAYQRFTTKNLAEKIKGLQGGESVDISGLMSLDERNEQLECDELCAVEERNKILAEALEIFPADAKARFHDVVQFPHFLEEHAKANMKLLYYVEDALKNLVAAVLKVQSPTLTHSFTSMNTKNRRFIHELATMYGCTSMSYDQEPNRNTVVTATKDCKSPRIKLSTLIQRQLYPQPPPPIPLLPDQGFGSARSIQKRSEERNVVDYFEDDF